MCRETPHLEEPDAVHEPKEEAVRPAHIGALTRTRAEINGKSITTNSNINLGSENDSVQEDMYTARLGG